MKKRIIPLLLVLFALFALNSCKPEDNPPETTETPQNSDFVIENGILISYSGSDSEVTVPEGVTGIAAGAFDGNSSIRVLILPATLTTVDEGCFDKCEALEEVRVTEGGAIGSSEGLVLSADGKSVIYINKAELAEDLVIPDGVETLAVSFAKNSTIRSVTFPLSLEKIPAGAFSECEALEKITLGGVREIGKEAFYSCRALVSADLGETRIVGESAFAYCNKLTDVTMTYVSDIKDRAFSNCGIKYLDFGKRLKTIEQNAFSGCSALSEIVLPDTIEIIHPGAFRSCGLKKVDYKGAAADWEAKKTQFIGITALKGYTLACLDEEHVFVETIQQFISNGDGTCTVTASRNKEESGVITIPKTSPEGDLVTSISGFSGCDNMTAIILPDTLTEIIGATFSGCDILERVEAPGVTKIGSRAFASCKKLQTVIFNSALEEIAESAFVECVSLTELPLHEGLIKIGESAFSKVGATEIVFPSTLAEVGSNAFEACDNLVRVDMSRSQVKNLRYTFYHCTKLSDVVFPLVLEEIWIHTFDGCSSLAEVTLPEGLKRVGDQAFSHTALTSIVIPDSVTTLQSAFRFCEKFNSLTLGKGVKVFECLGHCIGFESYVIPDTVTSIGTEAFIGCVNLREVTIPETVTSIGVSAFRECTKLTEIVIPDKVTLIDNGAFSGCTALVNVKLPKNLKTLEVAAFSHCYALPKLELPESVTYIGGGCFSDCTSLESITMPKKMNTIGTLAFENCRKLKSITIPEGVTELGERVFIECNSLKTVNLPSTLTTIGWRCFEKCTSLESITLPKKLINVGSDAFRYCTALTSVKLNEGLRGIEGYAFADCTALAEIYIPASIEWLNAAFIRCTGLKTLTFAAGSICSLSSDAFTDCSGIETIIFKDPSKLSAPSYVFSNLPSLKTVKIEKGTLHVGDACFSNCPKLSQIDFSKLSFLGNSAFSGCTSLPSEIVIPANVPVIGAYAFAGCTSIEKITVSPYIRWISQNAFDGCTSLTEITIGLTAYFEKDVFKNCTALKKVNYPGGADEFAMLIKIEGGNDPLNQAEMTYLDSLPVPKGYKLARRSVTFTTNLTQGSLLFDPANLTAEVDDCPVGTDTEGYLIAVGGKKAIVVIWGYYYLIDSSVIAD